MGARLSKGGGMSHLSPPGIYAFAFPQATAYIIKAIKAPIL